MVTARGSTINLYLSGSGNSLTPKTLTTSERWGDPDYNWAGDFNGDGFVDLASAIRGGDVILRLFDGKDFRTETWQVTTPWGGPSYSWVADFNNDGKTDIATARDNDLYLHLSRGNEFKTTAIISPGWGGAGYNWTGDYNGDGFVDLASAIRGGLVKLRLGNGRGFEQEDWSVSTDWGGANYSWAEDFDGDGKTDLASARDSNLFLHLSDGQQFKSETIASSNAWGQGRFNGAGDFNGDGKMDIAAVGANGGDVVVRLSTGEDFDLSEWKTTGYRRP